jgi:glycosyltransferase involved in cell wall biosynthesis
MSPFRKAAKAEIPGARVAFAGTGPCLERLRADCPDAIFLGWLDADRLAEAYSAADLLLLPSWFDTFSCSLLEALGCGLPAIAFDTKGPRDILAGEAGGLLAEGPEQMADMAARLLRSPQRMATLKRKALARAAGYRPEAIMDDMLRDLGLAEDGALRAGNGSKKIRRRTVRGEAVPASQDALLGELLALMEG